jgi:hypothetical protein
MFGAYNIVTNESYPILEIMEAMEKLRERKKMGGDRGIHLPPTNTEEDGN